MPINILRVGVRRMGPDSFQWCSATGQGAMGTNWSIRSSIWTWGRTSSFWGWWSTGTGCPEGLWILLLWRYSKPSWTRSCAACSGWPCFSKGVGLDDPRGPFQPLTFCDSVWNHLLFLISSWCRSSIKVTFIIVTSVMWLLTCKMVI